MLWSALALAPLVGSHVIPHGGFTLAVLSANGERANDVPLVLWTSPSFPTGLVFGAANGISFGDYDADGFIDVFVCYSRDLWKNVGGVDWQFAGKLPAGSSSLYRYGSSFGDYDNDGLPDIATEPRQFGCMALMHNLGGGPNFVDVASDPSIVDVGACNLYSETICWGDVDGDANLDLFLPTYPPIGNYFYYNRGPLGPGGAYAFNERSAAAGLDLPASASRPEGAQFCDVDRDGDIDLYSNGTLYQNRSSPGHADFDDLSPAAAGIPLQGLLEEGALFCDYDLDGDQDLIVAYVGSPGIRIHENYGDGTFFVAASTIIDNPMTGLGLGLSACDWDNDGDLDITTRQVFRRNQRIETGARKFTVATHSIPAVHIHSATPAWGDWDRDGDLDCALGNWTDLGRFYLNTTYDASTPSDVRRYVRVKPLRDSTQVPAGLETGYGATVDVAIRNAPDGHRRTQFTASSAGYLNQNEYALHFGLPADPFPLDPANDLELDITVDFPMPEGHGTTRVDRYVNPRLGALDLATLTDREIDVFRSGTVVIDGVSHPPLRDEPLRLATSAGGLILPTATVPLLATEPASAPNFYVGLVVSTRRATRPVRVRELILDGELDLPVPCGSGAYNVLLWDVTDEPAPVLDRAQSFAAVTSRRNRRSFLPCEMKLAPGRLYMLATRMKSARATPIAGPVDHGSLEVLGGAAFYDREPCTGDAVRGALVQSNQVWSAIRFAQ
jgi:hypothetical protein